MSAALELPDPMSLDAFLVWDAPEGAIWQLVDGEPRAMAPASPIHGRVQGRLFRLIEDHFESRNSKCVPVVAPGVKLGKRADMNYRIPDLAVTYSPLVPGELMIPDPVLLVEILSPGNPAETWMNVWAYTTIPSVKEILVVHSTSIRADILRRDAKGAWPEVPTRIEGDDIVLESIDFQFSLADLYARTWLAQPPAA
jgi:Uma2 family endonuclease